MANNSVLKAAIADVVKQNGTNAITGNLLQQALLSMIDALGGNYQYAGIATPSTNPGTPDQNVFYLASTSGTYTNFGGIVLADGEIAILKYNGSWTKDVTGAATSEAVSQLGQELFIKEETLKLCKYTGYIYQIVNGELVKNTTLDTDIVNSDFIDIKNLYSVECNGAEYYGNIAVAAFAEKDLSTLVWSSFGTIPTPASAWTKFSSRIDNIGIPQNAKYLIIQVNRNSLFDAYSYLSYIKTNIAVSELESVLGMSRGIISGKTINIFQYTGKLYKLVAGEFIVSQTNDVLIKNSNFIPIDDLITIGVNGSEYENNIAIAYFSEANYDSFISASFGITPTPISRWDYIQADINTLEILAGAKYAILQVNGEPAINGNLLTTSYFGVLSEKINDIENKINTVYNVKKYGATGNGITDDTLAIQAAIDACFENGGGDVYFPNGVYNLASVSTRNGQTNHLFIPMSASISVARQIRLVGESVNTYKMYTTFSGPDGNRPVLYGSVLKSTYLPDALTLSEPIAIIGSEPNSDYITGANETRIVIERLSLVSKLCSANYPMISGINAIRLAHIHVRSCMITSDSAAAELQAPPSGHICFGFAGCNNLCDPPQGIEDTNICGGFQYGIIACEHLCGRGVDIQTCINAFAFGFAYHPNYFSLCSAHNCKNQIVALDAEIDNIEVGHAVIKFDCLDIECNKGATPTGFNFSCGIEDPSNLLIGSVEYLMVNGQGSESVPSGIHNNFWNVDGASGVNVTTLNPIE